MLCGWWFSQHSSTCVSLCADHIRSVASFWHDFPRSRSKSNISGKTFDIVAPFIWVLLKKEKKREGAYTHTMLLSEARLLILCRDSRVDILVNKIIAILGKHASYPDGLNFEASSLFPFHNKLHGGWLCNFLGCTRIKGVSWDKHPASLHPSIRGDWASIEAFLHYFITFFLT